MKSTFEQDNLHDVKDNWLKEQIKLEARNSVWDLDDNASYLDREHREKCEANQIKRAHHQAHLQFDEKMDEMSQPLDVNSVMKNSDRGKQVLDKATKTTLITIVGAVIFIIYMVILIFVIFI